MNTNLPSNGNNNPFEIFNYKNLGSVRTTKDDKGNPLFCLSDVCSILGIQNPKRVTERLLDPGVHTMNIGVQTGVKRDGTPAIQNIPMIFIDQGNLFKVIFTSRKPEAQNFANWVSYEVLPTLARTGSYHMPNNKTMTEMEMIHTISGEVIKNTNDIKELKTNVQKNAQTLELHRKYIMVILKEGYYTVASAAKLVGVPLSLETAKEIGSLASEQCKDRGLTVASIPHPEYGRIRAYPYFVIADVLKNYVN